MNMLIKKFLLSTLLFVSTCVIAKAPELEHIAVCKSPSLTTKVYSQDGWQMDNTGLFKDGMPMLDWVVAQESGDGDYKCTMYTKPKGWFWNAVKSSI